MSISVCQHIPREKEIKVELSEEREVVANEPHRVLSFQTDEGDVAIFLTTEQAEQVAVNILAKLKADKKQDQKVA